MQAFFTSKFSTSFVEVVFFDAAGTLIRTAEPVGVVYARVAERHGVSLGVADAEAGFRRAFKEMGRPDYSLKDGERAWWRELVGRVFGEKPSDVCFSELFGLYGTPEAWRVFPEVFPVLEQLRAGGVRLGVVSNFDARLVPVLEGLGLMRYFESVTYSGEAGAAKPSARIFEVACGRMGVSPEACVLVGDDRERDLVGAEAVGMRCVLVDSMVGVRGRDLD